MSEEIRATESCSDGQCASRPKLLDCHTHSHEVGCQAIRSLTYTEWRLLQKSTVSQSCLQDCSDFAEWMKRKTLRVRSKGSTPPYVTEAESRKQHSDSVFSTPKCNFKGETFVSFKNYRTFVVAKEQRNSRHSRLVGAVASELA